MTPGEAARLEDVIGWIGVAINTPAMVVWVVMVIRARGQSRYVFPLPFIVSIPISFMHAVLSIIQGKGAMWPTLMLGVNAYIVYRWWKDGGNDRWKKLKAKLASRVQAMNGRLVVVPVRS